MERKGVGAMKISEAQYKSSQKYQMTKCRNITMQLNREYDEDILTWLDSQENKQGYLKALIREDMKKQGFVFEKSEEK